MAFRNDLDAAHARAKALETEVAVLKAENSKLRGGIAVEPEEAEALEPRMEPIRRSAFVGIILVLLVGAGVAVAVFGGSSETVAMVIGPFAFASVAMVLILNALVHVCPPGFAIVLCGQSHQRADGSKIGFRVVTSGRVVRVPILEEAKLLDCRPRTIECNIRGAYCSGGSALGVKSTAVVQLGTREPLIGNAVERFLGQELTTIDRVAREVLESFQRSVIAQLTREELQSEGQHVAERIMNECEDDMEKLGMELSALSLHVEV